MLGAACWRSASCHHLAKVTTPSTFDAFRVFKLLLPSSLNGTVWVDGEGGVVEWTASIFDDLEPGADVTLSWVQGSTFRQKDTGECCLGRLPLLRPERGCRSGRRATRRLCGGASGPPTLQPATYPGPTLHPQS